VRGAEDNDVSASHDFIQVTASHQILRQLDSRKVFDVFVPAVYYLRQLFPLYVIFGEKRYNAGNRSSDVGRCQPTIKSTKLQGYVHNMAQSTND
jgi:hypothetical protein